MPRNYVDNAMNRSLGRVGMPLGSAVHSRGSGGSSGGGAYFGSGGGGGGGGGSYFASASFTSCISGSSSPKTYADNAQNRSLGRVGMEHGTAVHSRSGASTSGYSSGGSPKTYADNAQNRSLGRVGMEHGTAVHSRSDTTSSSGYSIGGSPKTYVDNAQNRRLGRVGMEHGTAVHSRSDTASSSGYSSGGTPKTYVDNPQNRRLGRVGMEHGTAVHSKDPSKVYKDNPLNRRLGRVGKLLGTMPHSRVEVKTPCQSHDKADNFPRKVYVDNAFNRKHNRVGLPLGSVPISRKQEVYRDTAINRALGRVGKPWGSLSRNRKGQILKMLRDEPAEDPTDLIDYSCCPEEELNDDFDHVLELLNRENAVKTYLESTAKSSEWQSLERTSSRIIDKYHGLRIDFAELELGVKIGHGGFGEVYFAEWRNEVVAVKKLKFQNLTKKRLAQFEEEILRYCTLDHPNVVRFIGACLDRPNLAIVMEYMDRSLYEIIHTEEVDLTSREKLKITKDVVQGMEYLHSQNFAHCDLKTQNVLINNVRCESHYNPDEDILAKITDFGLSKMKSDMETSSSARASEVQIGTPRYSAPEVLRGEDLETDQLFPTDIYSMGLLIYELAVEEVPFEDLKMIQLRKQVGEKGLKPSMPPGITFEKDVKDLLHKTWQFDPDDRPTASKVAAVAEQFTSLLVEEEE